MFLKAEVNQVLSWLLRCPFGLTPRFKVTVASVGRPCFAPPHPLCPMWESLRGPWHAPWETPQRSSRRRAPLTHHFHSLKQVSFLHPSSLMEPNHHYRLNNRHSGHSRLCDVARIVIPGFSPSFHQLTSPWMKPTGTQTTAAGSSIPQKGKSRGLWLRGRIICGLFRGRSPHGPGLGLLQSPREEKHSQYSCCPTPPPFSRHRNSINMPWMETDRQALSSAAAAREAGRLVESQREIVLCMNVEVPLTTAAGVMSARLVGLCVGFPAHPFA